MKQPSTLVVVALVGIPASAFLSCANHVSGAEHPRQAEEGAADSPPQFEAGPTPESELAPRTRTVSGDEKDAVAVLEKLGATVDQNPDGEWAVLIADIRGTKGVDDSWLVHLTDLKNLTALQFSDAGITDAGLATLGKLVDLEQLDFNGCSKVSGAGLKHVCGLAKLRSLDLLGTSVDDDSLVHLKGLKQLTFLRLDCTRISDAGLAHLRPLSQLEILHMTAPLLPFEPGHDRHFAPSKIGDAGLVHLARLPRIRQLNLAHTNVTDAGLEQLSGLPGLDVLMLSDTRVSLDGLKKLRQHRPQCEIHHPLLDAERKRRNLSSERTATASLHVMIEEFDTAIEKLNEAIELNPRNADAYFWRASAWEAKAKFERAIVDYDKAIRLNPQLATAKEGRRRASEKLREIDRSEEQPGGPHSSFDR